jgi:hypothetical protein
VIGLCHPVGDFVTRGTPLLEVWGPPGLDASRLRGLISLGVERTLEQDAAFALRIMVDIALAALSPAVNAPSLPVHGRRSRTGGTCVTAGCRQRREPSGEPPWGEPAGGRARRNASYSPAGTT